MNERVKIFLSYASEDENKVKFLYENLTEMGFKPWMDKLDILPGEKWTVSIKKALRNSDFIIVCLSNKSVIKRGVFQKEIRKALDILNEMLDHDIYLIPVRLEDCEIPENLSTIQTFDLFQNDGTEKLEKAIKEGIKRRSISSKKKSSYHQTNLEKSNKLGQIKIVLETGTVKLDSPFYIKREADLEIFNQINCLGTTTFVKGPFQVGKSSLLARAYDSYIKSKRKACYIDFQMIGIKQLESLESLLLYLARKLAKTFRTLPKPEDFWNNSPAPQDSFTDFIEEAILSITKAPVLILFDGVDRVFNFDYWNDFFNTIHSWHNLRAINNNWKYLNLIIAHLTEPHLWIKDIEKSLFGVGYQIQPNGFNFDQVSELNKRHGYPLKNDYEINELLNLVGGQPYLVRKALCTIATNGWSMGELKSVAYDETGPFEEHLSGWLSCLQISQELKNSLCQILNRGICSDLTNFYRLKNAGLIIGEKLKSVQIRCQLYEEYFRRNL